MFEILLPNPVQVSCDDISISEDSNGIMLQLVANTVDSACPKCGQKTSKLNND